MSRILRLRRAGWRLSLLSVGGVCGGVSYAATHDVYPSLIGPCLLSLDGETAQRLAVRLLRLGVAAPYLRRYAPADAPVLALSVWGHELPNPIGLAAGLDKDAEAVRALFALGFALVEVGTVTPRPQPGNPRPRVFRLREDRAVVNRCGCNSAGAPAARRRLAAYDGGGRHALRVGALGVNVGPNADTRPEHAAEDYCAGVRELGEFADYVVINVSSPNTKGLRELQRKEKLRGVLVPVLRERDGLMYRPPVLVKVAPDLDDGGKRAIAEVVRELGVDGIVVCNTTVRRDGLRSVYKTEEGGLSGAPLEKVATNMVGEMYRLTEGQVPIVGVGGVESGEDAYRKIRAGASVVQIYTALVYQGPWMVDRVKSELAQLLERDGFKCVNDAVGADHPDIKRR